MGEALERELCVVLESNKGNFRAEIPSREAQYKGGDKRKELEDEESDQPGHDEHKAANILPVQPSPTKAGRSLE